MAVVCARVKVVLLQHAAAAQVRSRVVTGLWATVCRAPTDGLTARLTAILNIYIYEYVRIHITRMSRRFSTPPSLFFTRVAEWDERGHVGDPRHRVAHAARGARGEALFARDRRVFVWRAAVGAADPGKRVPRAGPAPGGGKLAVGGNWAGEGGWDKSGVNMGTDGVYMG
eukprot:365719-Chlamydomonas_euryale.AAC.9